MKRLCNAFVYACNGIGYAFKKERNFRIELFCAVAVCIAGYVLKITQTGWLIVLINTGTVLSAELFNTAIEKLCNTFTTEFHPSVKVIKDASAAAVLLSVFFALICGMIVFIDPVIHLIKAN